MNYIAPIKSQLEKELNIIANIYKVIGTPLETPRYFNFRNFNEDTKVLIIGSTQNSLAFEIQTNFKWVDVNDFWAQFKEFRTDYLKENHPTIETF